MLKLKVCIAEKPSVAREIAEVLGAKTKKDGFYEGNGYAVTYTFGHLCTLLEPNDYKPQWKSWNLNNLPMLPEKFEAKVVDNGGIKKQFNVIKDLLQKADVVINCAGLTKHKPDAENPLLSLPINTLMPHRLAGLCKLVGARMIHVSTDCVFSGDKGNYVEEDITDA